MELNIVNMFLVFFENGLQSKVRHGERHNMLPSCYDVISLLYDLMMVFCVNKFPPMNAA